MLLSLIYLVYTYSQQILEVKVFVAGNFATKGVEYGMTGKGGSHDRLQISYKSFNVHTVIHSEIDNRKGRSMILSK